MRRIALALLALMLCFAANAEMQPGTKPPDALGKSMDGKMVSLSALNGKVVVISFWATWCGYCMKEMPVLAGLQAQATAHHLPLQVVSIDHKESRDVFLKSARLIKRRLPDLLLSWDPDGKIGEPYGADNFIPVMVMLHRDGTVAHIHAGYSESMLDTLVSEINELLLEPAASPASGTLLGQPHTTAATN